jgi:hypothetical protein
VLILDTVDRGRGVDSSLATFATAARESFERPPAPDAYETFKHKEDEGIKVVLKS